MRLGQLARQLDIKTEKIVSFLENEKNLTVKTHPNSKVEDDLIDVISAHFAVAVKEEVVEAKVETPLETKEVVKEEVVAEDEKVVTLEKTEVEEKLEDLKSSYKGPKIIGKIDLPDTAKVDVEIDGVIYSQEFLDKKKKEDQAAERERKAIDKEARKKEAEEKKKKALEKRQIEAERQAMLAQEKNNILTAAEEKKKAALAKEQEEREKKIEARRKEKQKEHYAKIKKASTPPKKQKANKTAVVEPTTIENTVEEPTETNVFKRFFKWLNSE